jgi:hypothetical protein
MASQEQSTSGRVTPGNSGCLHCCRWSFLPPRDFDGRVDLLIKDVNSTFTCSGRA